MTSPEAKTTTSTRLGTIAELWRHPIKSMQGEQVDSIELDEHGIVGDRRLALRDLTTGTIVSAKRPRLGRLLLTCRATTFGDTVTVTVGDVTYDIHADRRRLDAALTDLLEIPVRIDAVGTESEVYTSEWPEIDGLALSGVTVDLPLLHGSFADLAPLHVLTTTSLHHLRSLAPEATLTIQRFRPGIVIDHHRSPDEATSFVENHWSGLRARLGTAELTFGDAAPRCVMTTLAQPGLDEDKGVLQAIARHNRRDFAGFGDFACLGAYADVTQPGSVHVGDTIDLLP